MSDISNHSARLLAVCALMLWVSGPVSGQSLRITEQIDRSDATASQRTVDFIVALVNSDPITNSDVRQRLVRVEQQFTNSGAVLPSRPELARQVLEQLVSERAQQQEAVNAGLRVDDTMLDQAEQSLAAQNSLTLDVFRSRLKAEGVDLVRFRSELRAQLLLQRAREREVELKVRVTDADIEARLRELNERSVDRLELSLAQVLIKVPDDASPSRIEALKARAQSVADRARAGADFAALAREFSEAPEAPNGGQFGWRPINRLPELFVRSTQPLAPGGTVGPVRSGAGFHVLKLIDRRQASAPEFTVTQTRARHILLRTGPQLSQSEALARLNAMRSALAGGQARFEDLAREQSQDGSAREGGSLGWVNPGQFVPEFETVMNALRPGEVSQPVVSRFGVHLIRVDERRDSSLSPSEQREVLRAQLREQQAQTVLQAWAQDVRSRAFVEYREEPRL